MPRNSAPSFSELIAGCHRSAIHLEMRDVYGVASEAEDFAEWKACGTITATSVERRRPWLDLVRETVGRGVAMRRARIVSTPVSEYIRYEHAGTYLNAEAGESVRWLPRRLASDLALPGNDLWLFDDRLIRFGHFTGDGASAGHEMCDDPAVIKLCGAAFEAVWERAVPHERFTV
ncbi:hypothetical protein AF335_10155 [Streptomyces eurocidicus]|uniref:DUF6879 domain-containing protein n=1 Tax=Streptomyces eurocidicus TaxID=66423 RepID=A0A2N8NWY4_STREU|nr:DUF6879 family protein [Streptomyces eurocidicus]MBB5117909.1 hypothetical protein [Streptomyces eurocidicus]MBF6053891.1 hypothetical protein [Streptomyces eurocidicus]PNE33278.1 hypothetical protein AF335_10155 [Streptomyces eurocidicus]